jgi:hypothetical protein
LQEGGIKDFAQRGNAPALAAGKQKMLHQAKGGAYTLYELRRFLGGATHFASFHEALAEQSASFVLANKLADTN